MHTNLAIDLAPSQRSTSGLDPTLRRKLLVEIHDVTPAAWAEVQTLAEALASLGIDKPALLVVPAFEDARGRWDLRDSPEAAQWLRERAAAGCEIVLHGLTHRAPAPPPPGLKNAFMHYAFSRGCAEFAHLDARKARDRLALGRRILAECGLSAEGFVAPAWQQSPAALAAVRTAGFHYTAFLDRVVPLSLPRWRWPAAQTAPALTFAAGHPLIDHGKRWVMRKIESRARDRSLLRVALHPEDVQRARRGQRYGSLLTHILRRIIQLQGERELTSYSDWLRGGAA